MSVVLRVANSLYLVSKGLVPCNYSSDYDHDNDDKDHEEDGSNDTTDDASSGRTHSGVPWSVIVVGRGVIVRWSVVVVVIRGISGGGIVVVARWVGRGWVVVVRAGVTKDPDFWGTRYSCFTTLDLLIEDLAWILRCSALGAEASERLTLEIVVALLAFWEWCLVAVLTGEARSLLLNHYHPS